MKELITYLYDQRVGVLTQSSSGNRTFQYDAGAEMDFSLSLALPYRESPYPRAITDPFIQGLIPEGESVRESLARQFEISSENPFALLQNIGLDCAGAVQFVSPEEIEDYENRSGELVSCDEHAIGKRLKNLISSPADSWIVNRERWSLGGAQGKFALRWNNGWNEASGFEATTHIFKPGIHDFRDQALNEHLCLKTLGALGLKVAETEYKEFDGSPAIVVERYDRVNDNGKVLRIHQEDFCQSTSTLPKKKYESDGGPSALKIIEVLRQNRASEDEVEKFIEGLIGNYLLGAPDAHAKNYSVLIFPDGSIHMAPFYDIASGLPYENTSQSGFPVMKNELGAAAMAIGGERRFGRVSRKHWAKFAASARLDEDWIRLLVLRMSTILPEILEQVLIDEREAIGASELPSRLLPSVSNLCESTITLLDRDQ